MFAPVGLAPEILNPIVEAVEANKAEIIDILLFLDAEIERGVFWAPPERMALQ